MKSYYLLTLGCQMNYSDSERIETILNRFKIKKTSEKEADLIVVNSCSVRQKPIDRIWGKLKVWSKVNPKAKKVLTGCVLPADLKKFKEKFDYFFRIEDVSDLALWLERQLNAKNFARINKFENYLDIEPNHQNKKLAYVPIMSGCNNFCSYCAVPYTRGREWSRRPEAITAEVKCLVKKGYKRIMLLGQNVNSYSMSNPKSKDDFVILLKKLVKIPGKFNLSFMSPHPKDFSDELIDLIARENKISKEIHLPMQSGDNKILKKMNRGYTSNDYLSLVQKMRKKIKGLRVSTDIIVGFPGETKQNFRNTLRLVKSSGVSKAYISIYSPREGTKAAKKFPDSISAEIKKKRWIALEKLINKKG